MNIKNLNHAIVLIAEKKDEIRNYTEADLGFEILSEEIEQLNDALQQSYGSYLEDALFNIYDEYCPDNDVQPIDQYIVPENSAKEQYGVAVEVDDFPGAQALLILAPNPTRFILKGNKEQFEEVVWAESQLLKA